VPFIYSKDVIRKKTRGERGGGKGSWGKREARGKKRTKDKGSEIKIEPLMDVQKRRKKTKGRGEFCSDEEKKPGKLVLLGVCLIKRYNTNSLVRPPRKKKQKTTVVGRGTEVKKGLGASEAARGKKESCAALPRREKKKSGIE